MKLLLLNYEYPPLGGGAGRAMQNIARQLISMGQEVDILTSHTTFAFNEQNNFGFNVYSVPSYRKGIHDCGLRGAVIYIFFAYFKMRKLLRHKKYDVVHYFFSLPTGFLSLLPGKHQLIPYIISLRGSDVPYYDIYNKKLNLMHKVLLPVTKFIWNHSKTVIAVTKSLERKALLINNSQLIEVIPNGIDTELFTPHNNGKRDDTEFRLIIVSRLIERKGIQYVLAALSELKDSCIRLMIIGEGSFKNELKNICYKRGLNNIVTFLGYKGKDTIPEYFAQSDVFILPSLSEAFGNVIAEAMACGLPIIGTHEGGIPDLVGGENGILVEPGNIEQIKSAIITMKADKEMRLKMGKANIEKIEQKYKWEKVALAYKEVYERSLNGSIGKN